MKAYMVYCGHWSEGCTLAWAKSPSRAKVVAMGAGWYDEYISMSAVRQPDFDKYSNGKERFIESNNELPSGVTFFSEPDWGYDDAL